VLQAIITQAGLKGAEGTVILSQPNTQVKVARPQEFDRSSGRVAGFITACKLYIQMRMRGAPVKKQIQWVLSYMQKEAANMWKCIRIQNGGRIFSQN